MDKLLTVIVPSYNMEKYLRSGLDSLLVGNDNAEMLDIIVVNDGSKDGTLAIARGYERAYPGIVRCVDKQNGNYGSCVNAGVGLAKGLYVRILDADDTYDTGAFCRYLSVLKAAVEQDGGPDLWFNDFVEVDGEGNVLKKTSYAFTGASGFTLADFDYVTKPWVWNPAICYKTNCVRAVKYVQSERVYYSDQQWDTIPMLAVKTVRYCPEVVYRYLIGRPDQSCNQKMKLRNFDMHIPVAIEILKRYAKSIGRYPEANLTLIRNHQLAHARYFYGEYLISSYRYLRDSALVKYDEALQRYAPDIYRQTGCCVSPGRFKFHYVDEWRRHNSDRTYLFVVYRAYQFLAKVKGRVLRSLWGCLWKDVGK